MREGLSANLYQAAESRGVAWILLLLLLNGSVLIKIALGSGVMLIYSNMVTHRKPLRATGVKQTSDWTWKRLIFT